MDAAGIVDLVLDHSTTVASEELAQFRHRHVETMLGNQARNAQPATPIAADACDRYVLPKPGQLAQGDETGWHPFAPEIFPGNRLPTHRFPWLTPDL
jgi:hypothetical protein